MVLEFQRLEGFVHVMVWFPPLYKVSSLFGDVTVIFLPGVGRTGSGSGGVIFLGSGDPFYLLLVSAISYGAGITFKMNSALLLRMFGSVVFGAGKTWANRAYAPGF